MIISNIRTQLLSICLMVLMGIAVLACKKDKSKNTDELPPATQQGLDTFGAKVNGEIFVPKSSLGTYGSNLNCQYYKDTQQAQQFLLSAAYRYEPDKTFRFFASGIKLAVGKFTLSNNANGGIMVEFVRRTGNLESTTYSVTPPLTGELIITRFDEKAFILSGTFSFDAVNDKGEKIEVREGRFDVKYQ